MDTLSTLNARARVIFQHIVENYLEDGTPIGSQTLSQQLETRMSSASIRAVMAELETRGLLYAPHISAGRLPTERGLRLFVEGLLQVGELSSHERKNLETRLPHNKDMNSLLTEAAERLSGLSSCASLILTSTQNRVLKHIEFMQINNEQILAVLVDNHNQVENRLIQRPGALSPRALQATLTEAARYLNACFNGRTITEIREEGARELDTIRAELGEITARIVKDGLAIWSGSNTETESMNPENHLNKSLIVRGHAHLLDNLNAMEDLERIRILFEDIERKKELIDLLSSIESGEGVRIFVGAETHLFSLSGSSLIVSTYKDADKKIIGILGVIAPTQSNYARIIPMVDHTARVASEIVTEFERNNT